MRRWQRAMRWGQNIIGSALLLGYAMGAFLPKGVAQTTVVAQPAAIEAGVAATKARMTVLRDEFVEATAKAGFTCPIAAPDIVVADVPSFGSYDSQSNSLTTPAWEQMTEGEQSRFHRLLEPGASEAAAREEFETGVHRWVFVHEMGHWWQACRRVVGTEKHYAAELGANRIAAAYWQERDPALIMHQRAKFEGILKRLPNPVPEGANVEAYFDANYDKLGPTPAYIWFQAHLCIEAFDEKLTFARALTQTSPQ